MSNDYIFPACTRVVDETSVPQCYYVINIRHTLEKYISPMTSFLFHCDLVRVLAVAQINLFP